MRGAEKVQDLRQVLSESWLSSRDYHSGYSFELLNDLGEELETGLSNHRVFAAIYTLEIATAGDLQGD